MPKLKKLDNPEIDLTQSSKKPIIELDRLAYNVFKKSTGGVDFDSLPDNVKKCWQDVVSALLSPKEYINKIVNN